MTSRLTTKKASNTTYFFHHQYETSIDPAATVSPPCYQQRHESPHHRIVLRRRIACATTYYANERNHLWDFLFRCLDPDYPPYQPLRGKTRDEKFDLILRNRIGLWDIIASCESEKHLSRAGSKAGLVQGFRKGLKGDVVLKFIYGAFEQAVQDDTIAVRTKPEVRAVEKNLC